MKYLHLTAAALVRLYTGFALLILVASPALAQTAPPTFLDQLSPILVNALATLIGLALTWATAQFASAQAAIKAKTGLDAERIMRDALHIALESGVGLSAAKGLNGQDAVNAVVSHVIASVPDAVEGLGASEGILANLARAKLAQVLGVAAK